MILFQIKNGYESNFKNDFKKYIIDIQNHGLHVSDYVMDNVDKVYVKKDGDVFLSSDLLRKQVEGLFDLMKAGKAFEDFYPKDFSETGAARTMAFDVKKWFRNEFINCF